MFVVTRATAATAVRVRSASGRLRLLGRLVLLTIRFLTIPTREQTTTFTSGTISTRRLLSIPARASVGVSTKDSTRRDLTNLCRGKRVGLVSGFASTLDRTLKIHQLTADTRSLHR